ncbi:hypothetical protein Tco_0386090 [Tanacetum coccineum]
MTPLLHQLDGVRSKRYHIVPFGEFNGVPVALVARLLLLILLPCHTRDDLYLVRLSMKQEVTRMVYKEERWQQEWQDSGVRSMIRIGVAWTTRRPGRSSGKTSGNSQITVASSVIDGILSIEARDMDTKLLSAPESNNTLARCWFKRNVPVTTFGSRGWSFVSAVSGQITHPVASLILDSARYCVMQSAFLTKRKASSIPTIFSWGGSIRTKGFLSFILLLAAIIVAAVMAVLIVVDAIIGVVVAVSGVPYIIKLSFVIIDFVHRIVLCYLIHQPMSYGNGFLQSLRLRGSNISFNTSR